ncbi:hypothetical protein CONPUDRAFT_76477 [Coniophora puteana RWD-64-598 SS2]|uniref:Uncharacterized protein n=1 Tax=Coniophora puteana (strain RWD-64-598) TaxID=741705 RepID=A0A5M3MD21_CONPW|nr:uncharacterized protein CONPUDRAFT_76477 [Coniophora puteana RWD-64-598 SS2]EIW76936.1 hypothetical protein CONPUDRAFT_76477 [Coniophora puteana RWD-64-598 SS2]
MTIQYPRNILYTNNPARNPAVPVTATRIRLFRGSHWGYTSRRKQLRLSANRSASRQKNTPGGRSHAFIVIANASNVRVIDRNTMSRPAAYREEDVLGWTSSGGLGVRTSGSRSSMRGLQGTTDSASTWVQVRAGNVETFPVEMGKRAKRDDAEERREEWGRRAPEGSGPRPVPIRTVFLRADLSSAFMSLRNCRLQVVDLEAPTRIKAACVGGTDVVERSLEPRELGGRIVLNRRRGERWIQLHGMSCNLLQGGEAKLALARELSYAYINGCKCSSDHHAVILVQNVRDARVGDPEGFSAARDHAASGSAGKNTSASWCSTGAQSVDPFPVYKRRSRCVTKSSCGCASGSPPLLDARHVADMPWLASEEESAGAHEQAKSAWFK